MEPLETGYDRAVRNEYPKLVQQLTNLDNSLKGKLSPGLLKKYEEERPDDYAKLKVVLTSTDVGPVNPEDAALNALDSFLDLNEKAKLEAELGKISKDIEVDGRIIFNVSVTKGVPTIKAIVRCEKIISAMTIVKTGNGWTVERGTNLDYVDLRGIVSALNKVRRAIDNDTIQTLVAKTSGGVTSRDLTGLAMQINNGVFKIVKKSENQPVVNTKTTSAQDSSANILSDNTTTPPTDTNSETKVSRPPEVKIASPEIDSPEAFAAVLKKNPTKYLNPATFDEKSPKEFTVTLASGAETRYSRMPHFVGPKNSGAVIEVDTAGYVLKSKVDGKEVVSTWNNENKIWEYEAEGAKKRLLVVNGTKFSLEKKTVVVNKAPAEEVKESSKDIAKEKGEVASLKAEFYGYPGVDAFRRASALKNNWDQYYKSPGGDAVFNRLMEVETKFIADLTAFNAKLATKESSLKSDDAKKILASIKKPSTDLLVALETHKNDQEKKKNELVALKLPELTSKAV